MNKAKSDARYTVGLMQAAIDNLVAQNDELVEALAELVSISESDGGEWNGSLRLDDALEAARAALAKAR